MRLPYGELTGEDVIDRLHVIAHDKFADIINAAKNEEFEFQQEYIDNSDNGLSGKVVQVNTSKLDEEVEKGNIIVMKPTSTMPTKQATLPVFTSEVNKKIGDVVREAINDVSRYVISAEDLTKEENQAKIVEIAEQKIKDIQLDNSELSLEPLIDVKETTKRYTESFIKLSINIPRIKVTYEQQGDFTFDDFDIETADFDGYQPIPQKVIVSELIDKSKRAEMQAEFIDRYENINHYILIHLIEENEIAYHKIADLLHKLIGQVISHITSYSGSELNTRKILFFYGAEISKKVYAQMKKHLREAPIVMRVKVDNAYETLTSASYKIIATEGQEAVDIHAGIKENSKIRSMVFTGFKKCLFSKQKFDSGTEKEFAELLERTPAVLKWFKISNDRAKEVFDIKYYNTRNQAYTPYLPDFVVETLDAKYMVETKAETEMDDKIVLAKKDAAVQWCKNASKFEGEHNGKNWHYLLIPDTTVVADRSFEKLVADYKED